MSDYFSDGNLLYAADLNKMYPTVYTRDLVSSSVTASVLTNVKSVSVPSNTFRNIMFIDVGFKIGESNTSGNRNYSVIALCVNGSTIYTTPDTRGTYDSSVASAYSTGSFCIPFTTSNVDLTSSCTVEVQGAYYNTTGTNYHSATCTYINIYGY